MDLNKLVNDSLAKIQEEGFVQTVVENRLKSTIESIINDVLREYSDFGKALKRQVQDQLQINFKELDISAYNHMILNVVKQKLDEAVHVQGVEALKKSMDAMLSDVKKEYKLSELIEEMKQDEMEYDDSYEGKEISFHDDEDSRVLRFISFDPGKDVGEYHCKYRITIDKNGKLVSVKIADKTFDNKVIMGGLHGVEGTLFKIYITGATLIVDAEDVELEYGYSYNDDY